MKTALIPVFAFGACASLALAEPLPQAAGAMGSVTAEAHSAGPIVLTEAAMDKVTAGGDRVYFNYHHFNNAVAQGNCYRCGNYYVERVVHRTGG